MAIQNKTVPTKASVTEFINTVTPAERKKDCKAVMKIMREVTGKRPKMWGSSIVGYGTYHYKYDSGREGDFLATGFSPRKAALTIYIMPGYQNYDPLLKKLGPHKLGKSCLYLKSLKDIDLKVLKQLIARGYKDLKKMYPTT